MQQNLSGSPLNQEELTEIIRNIPDSIAIYDRNGELVLCSNLVLESAEPDPLGTETPLLASFEVLKTARYGAAYVTILTPKN